MRIIPFLKVTRILNGILVFVSVYVGAIFAGALRPTGEVLMACLSLFLIAGGGYAINDYFDYETDSVNRPSRPIPSGQLNRIEALVLSLLLMGGGIAAAQFIGRSSAAAAILISVLLLLYSYALKRVALAGNFTVSLLCGSVFLYGGLSVGKVLPAFIPAVFSFLFHFGREILKDIEDTEGDRRSGISTIPIRWGERRAVLSATLIYLLLIALTPVPYLLGLYRLRYLIAVTVMVDLPLSFVIAYAWKRDCRWGNVNRVLKLIMPAGLVALYLGI